MKDESFIRLKIDGQFFAQLKDIAEASAYHLNSIFKISRLMYTPTRSVPNFIRGSFISR
jgi:hypothetical protein